ncbi:hypothetical protein [Aureliella helgolandensis]|nr:hypothetical protein [Aureliella helgolandensis]
MLIPPQRSYLLPFSIFLCSFSWMGLVQSAQAQSTIQEQLRLLEESRLNNEERLISAEGKGVLKRWFVDTDSAEPLQTTDATIDLLYDSSKFLLIINNHFRLQELRVRELVEIGDLVADRIPAGKQWEETNISKTLVLGDGDAIYSAEWLADGSCTGEIDFVFSRQSVLRTAGYPFEHPLHLWKEALNISRIKPEQTKLTPLASGGLIGIESLNTFNLKFYFFGDFGFDLRRVSTQRMDTGLPIREYSFDWGESAGVHYLKRFSSTINLTATNEITREHTIASKKTLEVDFVDFKVNQPIEKNRFLLSHSGIPIGTHFTDNRSQVAGREATLEFDGTRLIPLNRNSPEKAEKQANDG